MNTFSSRRFTCDAAVRQRSPQPLFNLFNSASILRRAALFLPVFVSFLSGCAQQSLLEQGEFAERYIQQRDALLAQTHWQLRGKIGIRTDGKAHSASLNWTQSGDQFKLRMAGPLGVGAVKLSSLANGEDKARVLLEQAGRPPRTAATTEQLLQQSIGIAVPLDNIKSWLRGLPTNARLKALQTDPVNGTIQTFIQDGWQVSYSSYQQFDNFLLPAKIKLQAADDATDQPYSNSSLTVLVQRWRFDQPAFPGTEPDTDSAAEPAVSSVR